MDTTITQAVQKINEIEKEMAGKELGDEILRLRLKAGWSQEELAQRIDLHQSRVSRLENGEHNYPLETVYRLAIAFDINPFVLAAIYWGVEVAELPDRDKETLDKFIKLAAEYINSQAPTPPEPLARVHYDRDPITSQRIEENRKKVQSKRKKPGPQPLPAEKPDEPPHTETINGGEFQ